MPGKGLTFSLSIEQAEDILAAGGVITCAETRLPVSVADTATEQKNSPRDNKSAFADSDDDGQ